MRGVVVGHNTGLGDQIVMNGAVRYLAEKNDKVWYVTWKNRAKHAEFLYKDCENVEIYIKPSIASARQGVMRMEAAHREIVEANPQYSFPKYKRCFWTSQKDWAKFANSFNLPQNTIFPRIFYAILGVDYGVRYPYQKIPRDFGREKLLRDKLNIDGPYVFVVNDCRSSVYDIDVKTSKRVINPSDFKGLRETLLYDWQTVIEEADEIHMVNTSWFHLARTLKINKPKFYYSARDVKFCEQNEEFVNDNYDSGWEVVKSDWSKVDKKKWWLT